MSKKVQKNLEKLKKLAKRAIYWGNIVRYALARGRTLLPPHHLHGLQGVWYKVPSTHSVQVDPQGPTEAVVDFTRCCQGV